MDNYFDSYREMVSLRGLSDHTLKSYSTYIRAYLDYLTGLGISPSNASWDDMRSFRRTETLLTAPSTVPFPSFAS